MSQRAYALVLAAVAGALLIAAYFLFAETDTPTTIESGQVSFNLTVPAGPIVREVPLLEVGQGAEVNLVIASEIQGDAHLHGYELQIALEPGEEASLTLNATQAGLFTLEVHTPDGAELHLATLGVRPR